MEREQREFLYGLLEASSPSGFEPPAQRVWVEYVEGFADEVWTDSYGNAVATLDGGAPSVVVAGHCDEVGFIVRRVDDDGFLHLDRIGGADRTVALGQHVTVRGRDGPVPGVVGQPAIHLREKDEAVVDVEEMRVDIGARDGDEARRLVEVGDPVTFSSTVTELCGTRVAGRGLDDRVGAFAAAETLRAAAESGVDATVHAVSTVQEEVGARGAAMVGFDLDPDLAVAAEVTHATDFPRSPPNRGSDISLGGGPIVARGAANHPVLVDLVRSAASDRDVEMQVQATGSRTGTDVDSFFTQRGGVPSLKTGVPARYLHTPVETLDTRDLDDLVAVLGRFLELASERGHFRVEV